MPNSFKILSIDGGGIRGVCPAAYLNYFQERIRNPINKYFDMIVGTSTGGIIALGLALGKNISEMLKLYKVKGKLIFNTSSCGILKPKYNIKILEGILKEFFSEKSTLEDSLCRVCIPSIDMNTGNTIVYKTRHHEKYINDYKIPVWKIATSTSSAPYYFRPHQDITGPKVDGGLWANNPSLIALTEAIFLGIEIKDIKILSIGTGIQGFYKKDNRYGFGLFGWRKDLIDLIFQVQSKGAENITDILCQNNYKRIQIDLTGKIDYKLDDCSKINELIGFALLKAQETFNDINDIFFTNMASEFKTIP